MGFASAVRDGFANYAKFDGRASRSAYWWWALFSLLVWAAARLIDAARPPASAQGFSIVFVAATLVLVLPSWSVAVRRLHDIDRSGWWVLIFLIPSALGSAIGFVAANIVRSGWWILIVVIPIIQILGAIVLLVFLLTPGTPGPNRFGPPPIGPPRSIAPRRSTRAGFDPFAVAGLLLPIAFIVMVGAALAMLFVGWE